MATYFDPVQSFINAYSVNGLVSLAFANGQGQAPTAINFAANTSQNNITLVTNAAASWDWVPLPVPNPQGFVNAITADSTLTGILFLLMPYYAAILNYASYPQSIKTAWAQLQASYSSLLTPQIISTVQGYATANNMPLT